MMHVFSLTKPKIAFCVKTNIDRVRDTIEKLGLDTKVYTFDDEIKESGSVDELLSETGNEKEFM